MKHYIVSDPHGYYTELENALQKAGFFDETEPHKLVICGDVLDRGQEANRMIEFLLQLKEENRLVYILGNHEDLLVHCMHKLSTNGVHEIASGMSHHYSNGTWNTLLQLGGMDELESYHYPLELVRTVMQSRFYRELLPAALDYYETEHYIFVHGWIPCHVEGFRPNEKYWYDPDWRYAEPYNWKRARWFNGMDVACKHGVIETGKTIVCGHWHTSYGHYHFEQKGSEFGADADCTPFYANGIIALDARTAVSKLVNCIVIDDAVLDEEEICV